MKNALIVKQTGEETKTIAIFLDSISYLHFDKTKVEGKDINYIDIVLIHNETVVRLMPDEEGLKDIEHAINAFLECTENIVTIETHFRVI